MDQTYRTFSIAISIMLSTSLWTSFAGTADNTPLVKHLVEIAQKSNGIRLLPHGGDLAFDLVCNSKFLVVSQEADDAKATAARAAADRAGLLGRRMSVAEDDALHPALADNYVKGVLMNPGKTRPPHR